MALFKILKGQKTNLPSSKVEGYAYVTTDEHKFYVDISNSERICLNADTADKLAIGNGAANQAITGGTNGIKWTNIAPAAEWTNYAATGPSLKISVLGATSQEAIIPLANTEHSGAVSVGQQEFRGNKIFSQKDTIKFSTGAKPYLVNKELTWDATGGRYWVILLLPELTAANQNVNNFLDGHFIFYKVNADRYNIVDLTVSCCYNKLCYYLQSHGEDGTFELCKVVYNNIKYIALKVPNNNYSRAAFMGHVYSTLDGGNEGANFPLDLPYSLYYRTGDTVNNAEINSSITTELVSNYITAAQRYKLNLWADGANITNLNASYLATGTVPLERLPSIPASLITSGILGVPRGGTGNGTWTKNQVVLTNASDGAGALTSRAYNDSSSASALGTSTNFVTERDIYYGLPTINNAHNYNSSTTIYAPTAGGTADTHALVGAGTTTAPKWVAINPTITITGGTTAGPSIKIGVLGRNSTDAVIPSASTNASGIVTTGAQSFAGAKTFGDITISGTTDTAKRTISSASTLYLNSAASTSFIIQKGGTNKWRYNADGTAIHPETTNQISLGISGQRWSKLFVGTADSYGSAYKPIWWSNGVPVAVTDNSLIVNLASTSGDSVFAQNPRPGVTGTLPIANGGTGATTAAGALVAFIGSTAIGGAKQPIYWDGTAFKAANAYSTLFQTFTSSGNTLTIKIGDTEKTASIINSLSLDSTAGTGSASQILTMKVNGQTATSVSLTKGTTSVIGVVKLTSSYTSTDSTLAATGASILAAIQTLDVAAVGGGTGEYISKISETDGKISATKATTTVSLAWTNGTASAGPSLKATVNGIASTDAVMPKGSTSIYGALKLTSAYTSSDSTLAATGASILAAIQTLDVAAVGGGTGEYISKISETDGKISATKATTTVANAWTGGTTAGPSIKTTVNGIGSNDAVIPSASASASGIVTTGAQTFAGSKTFSSKIIGDLQGNADTASAWQTARTFTVGNKGQSVKGNADVTWALNDILLNATQIGAATSWDQIGPSVYYVASSTAFTGTNHPGSNSEQAPYTYGQLIVSRAGAGGILQVYAPHTGSAGNVNSGLRYRTGWNSAGWQVWSTILDDRLWRKYIFANKNIGRSTLTVTDSTWAVTSGTDVFGLSFKDSGLQYTPSGGSATVSTDSGDWRAWLTCAAASNTVTLNMRIDGTWQASKFIGPLQGNADSATKLATARAINGTNFDGTAAITTAKWGTARTLTIGGTGKSVDGSANVSWTMNEIMGSSDSSKFYRGDKTWSDTLTGSFYIKNTSPHMYLVNTNWTKGTTPTSNYYSAIEFQTNSTDYASNKRVGLLEVNIDTSNNVWMNIWTVPNASASTAWSGIRMKRASDGTLTIYNAGSTEVSGTMTASSHVHSNGGYLKSTLNSNTVQIGSQNTGFCHITNSANIPFWFNKTVQIDGSCLPYTNKSGGSCGDTSHYWNGMYSYKKIFIVSNESTDDSTYLMFYASDNTERARIIWNGNCTNAKDNNNYMKLRTSYGDIRLEPASASVRVAGTLDIHPSTGSYTEGIRIYPTGSWATIMLLGTDTTATSGTSANSWGLFNNNGNFYLTRNGSSSTSSAMMRCVSNGWYFYGNVYIGSGGAGGYLNSGASNGGINSILIGDDVWLGDCNQGGIMGMKSTGANCGFWFYNSSGTNIGQLYARGGSGDIYSNKPLLAPSTASSWLDGQRYERGGFNLTDATDSGSYWPWLRQTNTNSAKWFSFGILGTSFYWIGSATSRTSNGYDYGMYFNVANGYLQGAARVYSAVWNDFAEMREADETEPGRVIARHKSSERMVKTTERLQPAAKVISDTYGQVVGQSDTAKTPIGVAGRVLVYPYQDRTNYKIGDALCAAPNGTADIMTREEITLYPDRIIGIVDEVPDYEVWEQTLTYEHSGAKNTNHVQVKGRIWMYVR